jgi:hypothetical protein
MMDIDAGEPNASLKAPVEISFFFILIRDISILSSKGIMNHDGD